MKRQVPRSALRVSEFAESLGLSRGHVYGLIKRGEVRVLRLGSAICIPVSELERITDGQPHDC